MSDPAQEMTDAILLDVLGRLTAAGLRWNHIERLMEFDGEQSYSLAQGED
jgi:hypothetical protein